jgi:hypothetical protein
MRLESMRHLLPTHLQAENRDDRLRRGLEEEEFLITDPDHPGLPVDMNRRHGRHGQLIEELV